MDHNISQDSNNAYKFIFIDGIPTSGYPIAFPEFAICSSSLLCSKNSKDQHLKQEKLLSHYYFLSFFKSKLVLRTFHDYWILIGLPDYLSNFYTHLAKKKNFYNHQILVKLKKFIKMVEKG
jgi:hypothetical protein